MIDFNEITNYERFEDLCEELLRFKGLGVRRLGRGPGQLGKDIIGSESFVGSVSCATVKTWLVEVKHTSTNRSLNEGDVLNISDRVTSQGANGYFLFTNARLGVNLERTLHDLRMRNVIDTMVWTENKIQHEVLNSPTIFRKFFPLSFNKYISDNRAFFVSQARYCKSPLIYLLGSLHLTKGLLDRSSDKPLIETKIVEMTRVVRSLIDEVDEFCANFTCD